MKLPPRPFWAKLADRDILVVGHLYSVRNLITLQRAAVLPVNLVELQCVQEQTWKMYVRDEGSQ